MTVVMTAAITTTYLYRSFKLEQNGLRDENLTSLCAEIANLRLEKLDLLSGSATAHLEKSVNDGVQVHVLLVRHCYYERARGAETSWSACEALMCCALASAAVEKGTDGQGRNIKTTSEMRRKLTQFFTER